MYPHQMEQMVRQHNDDVRTQAHLARRRVRHAGPRNSVRHRAGWTLVEIGLRLAGASDDA